ncbi:hypothetical protein [Thermococcus profundus]|nr:hypothetical protein [Thermococcus profundus]
MVWFVLGLMIGSLFLVAAYPQGSSPKNDTPPFQKIENSILVYYIGNETPSYFLRTAKVTGFRKIKTPHVLIVEGSYVENSSQLKQFIKEEILSGIPVIVKDNPELLKGIFKGQFYPRIVGGRNPDGTPLG